DRRRRGYAERLHHADRGRHSARLYAGPAQRAIDGHAADRQRPAAELRTRADDAHDQHLYARRSARSGRDRRVGEARRLCRQFRRRSGRHYIGQVRVLGVRGLSDGEWQGRPRAQRRDVDRQRTRRAHHEHHDRQRTEARRRRRHLRHGRPRCTGWRRPADAADGRTHRGWHRRMILFRRACVSALAAFLALIGPAFAACDLAQAPTTRWRAVEQDGRAWLVDPCGVRTFSIGVNVLDDGLSGAKLHRPHYDWHAHYTSLPDWIDATDTRLHAWGFNAAGAWSLPPSQLRLPTTIDLELGRLAKFHWFDPFRPDMGAIMDAEAAKLI